MKSPRTMYAHTMTLPADLIALTGFKGSGKTTIAECLTYTCTNVVRLSFADAVRAAAGEVFGLTRDEMVDQSLKEQRIERWSATPRELLQRLGMAMRDNFTRDVWVKALAERVEDHHQQGRQVVIDDCRFPNEAEWVREMGGVVVGVKRPGVELDDDHASEVAMAENWQEMVDLDINNCYTDETRGPGLAAADVVSAASYIMRKRQKASTNGGLQ